MTAIRNADASLLADPVARAIDRAEEEIHYEHPGLPPSLARDAAVIAGVTAAMSSLKLIKTLPGLPFAPGHKNAVMLPLYLVGSELTTLRFGATACGFSMGTIAFLMGDGRYGVFEIAKHVAPGVVVDLAYPLVKRLGGTSAAVLGAFGAVLAACRLATEVAVAVFLGVPGVFYAYVGLAGVSHVLAGVMSGFVSAALLRGIDVLRAEPRP